MAKIGFIGMGNMGYAMLKGALRLYEKADILFSDANPARVRSVYEETSVSFAESNAECANRSEMVVLAVKPQFYPAVLKNIVNVITPDQIIISIAPGYSIEDLQNALGYDRRIVRAMPNTPALIGEGMTGVCYQAELYTDEEKERIHRFFSSFGKMEVVPERLINAVVCASGSSPAYVYMFIEALADSAVQYGMPRDAAYKFAAQTVQGAAKMVLETGEHPGRLKDMVCSPGVTTIAGVAALEEYGFRNAVLKASERCYEKCGKLK